MRKYSLFKSPVFSWLVSRMIAVKFQSVFFCLFVCFFLVELCLRCCAQAFSSCIEGGLLFTAVRGLLIAVASLVAEHGL